MKLKRDSLSNTSLKAIHANKYCPIARSIPPKDMSKVYTMYSNGWRKKKVANE